MTRKIPAVVLAVILLAGCCQQLSNAQDFGRLSLNKVQQGEIRRIVNRAIRRGNMAGCVVAIGDRDGLTYLRAFGNRQTEPAAEPMTTNTVFDLASLTKPIATATSIMKLVEQGKIAIDDPVVNHWPEFGKHGKDRITIRQLLTHQGGLIPDNHLRDYENGADEALIKICNLKLVSEPGTRFSYTDVGFIVLAEVVRRVSGKDISSFADEHFYHPLGMSRTTYNPNEAIQLQSAATEKVNGKWLKGEVHDPRASRMGGVAGHAGLFSNAHDLSRFARMLLSHGELDGVRVLAPTTVRRMSTRQPVSSGFRTLGWDSLSGYSSNRGDLFSASAFGHGGFTGTSFWVDPEKNLFVIFLSNRLHPDGKGSVNSIAGRIGTIAAATRAFEQPNVVRRQPVSTGIDVLVKNRFAPLAGKKVGLITNQTGIANDGTRTASLFGSSSECDLVALFSPEHGIDGKLDVRQILDSKDVETGIQVFSLYGKNRAPTADNLKGIEVMVFDIQDIGCRFYTYISTMGLAMEACEKHGVEFVVLDRPNPINGLDVQGPGIDSGSESFIAFHDIPVRHGMTVGELAKMFQAERGLDQLKLKVIPLQGWKRSEYFDQTGLRWVNPSPNMRNITQALLYPGIGLLETTNLSVGRGTDTPFEVIGAPWVNELELAMELNQKKLPGVSFVPVQFTPNASKFKDQLCRGIRLLVWDRVKYDSLQTGFQVARCLFERYPEWNRKAYNGLLRNEQVHRRLTTTELEPDWQELGSAVDFEKRRRPYLLYEIDR